MLVEDNKTTLMIMARLLRQKLNYNVLVASSVGDALRVADEEKGQFDLVISDIGLPDGSGLDLMAALKAKYNMQVCACGVRVCVCACAVVRVPVLCVLDAHTRTYRASRCRATAWRKTSSGARMPALRSTSPSPSTLPRSPPPLPPFSRTSPPKSFLDTSSLKENNNL
jgi:CheY-like chemotaxis protein